MRAFYVIGGYHPDIRKDEIWSTWRYTCRETWFDDRGRSEQTHALVVQTSDKTANHIIKLINQHGVALDGVLRLASVKTAYFSPERQRKYRYRKDASILHVNQTDIHGLLWFILFQRIAITFRRSEWNTLDDLLNLSTENHFYESGDRENHIKVWRHWAKYITSDEVIDFGGVVRAAYSHADTYTL